MANPRFSDVSPAKGTVKGLAKPPGQMAPAPKATLPAESTANWGGLPGKTQSKDRSGGVKKVRVHAKSEGI